MPDLLSIVSNCLTRLDRSKPVLVAVSGGSDSTGLMLAACQAAKSSGHRIVGATVDHGLRAGSATEARIVGDLCAREGIEHHILHWNDAKPETGIPAAARLARYRLLTDLATDLDASAVLLGHTLNDQAETIAMRAERSQSDALGLSGMAPDFIAFGRVWFLRPLLSLERGAIRGWLTANGQGWIDDPSNDNADFERVRIRQSGTLVVDRHAIRSAMDRRADLGRQAAEIICRALDSPQPWVTRLRLGGLDLDGEGDQLAIRTIAALVGGSAHRPGQDMFETLKAFIASGRQGFAPSMGRAELHRKGEWLTFVRQNRNLPIIWVEPGQTMLWDNRFSITNLATKSARISGADAAPPPGTEEITTMLTDFGNGKLIPSPTTGRLHHMCVTVHPHALGHNPTALRLRRILSIYRDFLPSFELPMAQAIMKTMGVQHFDPLPARPGSELNPS